MKTPPFHRRPRRNTSISRTRGPMESPASIFLFYYSARPCRGDLERAQARRVIEDLAAEHQLVGAGSLHEPAQAAIHRVRGSVDGAGSGRIQHLALCRRDALLEAVVGRR